MAICNSRPSPKNPRRSTFSATNNRLNMTPPRDLPSPKCHHRKQLLHDESNNNMQHRFRHRCHADPCTTLRDSTLNTSTNPRCHPRCDAHFYYAHFALFTNSSAQAPESNGSSTTTPQTILKFLKILHLLMLIPPPKFQLLQGTINRGHLLLPPKF